MNVVWTRTNVVLNIIRYVTSCLQGSVPILCCNFQEHNTNLNKGTMYSNCTQFYQYHKLIVTEAIGVCGAVSLEPPILCFLLHYLLLPLVCVNKSKLLAARAGYQMLHKYQHMCEQNEYTIGEQTEEHWRGECASLEKMW